jgi:hypothetical protein
VPAAPVVSQPRARPRERRGGGVSIVKIALGIILAFTIIIAGCVALLGTGVDKAPNNSDKTAITTGQYDQAQTGTWTKSQTISAFGTPQDAQDMQAAGIQGVPDSGFSASCIYYGEKGHLASAFQFCFDDRAILSTKLAI